MFTSVGHTARHETVVRDALIPVTRSYGYAPIMEPRFYTYANGHHCRPDITFDTSPKLAIDLTIVYPQVEAGFAAIQAADDKVKKHGVAVEAIGHVFLPFAMEISGHLEQRSRDCLRMLANQLLPVRRHRFYMEMNHAISVAIARGRANAVKSAILRTRAATAFTERKG